jgi:hypothetical protein
MLDKEISISREPSEFKEHESRAENKKKNSNIRDDTITKFFSSLLNCAWFQKSIVAALNLIILTFLMLVCFLAWFILNKDTQMIDVVLGIMFKIASPCIIVFLFFIKFGEYKG